MGENQNNQYIKDLDPNSPCTFPFQSLTKNVVMSPHRGGAPGLPETEARRMVAICSWIKDLFFPSNEGSMSDDDFNWKVLKNKLN